MASVNTGDLPGGNKSLPAASCIARSDYTMS
jgi:hypothetical protein